MKKTLLIIGIILLVLIVSVIFKIVAAVYTPAQGTLRIKSNPLGSVITLENKQIGTTPYKEGVSPGDHVLRLINNTGNNKLAWEKAISITPSGQTEVNLDFGPSDFFNAGEILQSDIGEGLLISTEPAESEIVIDDTPMGKAPLYIDTLNPGKHKLRINKPNYISRDIVFNIIPGSRLATSFYLSKDPMVDEPKLLESNQSYALYGIYTEDSSLLNDTQQWSKGVFFLQKDAGTEQNKVITEIIDHRGLIFTNPDNKGGTQKVIGYIGPRGQAMTQEAQRKYYELIGKEVETIILANQFGTIGNSPTNVVSLRQEPSISAAIIGRVSNGERVELLEQKGAWYKIRSRGADGWVTNEFVKKQ
jgi:hypothetical protein